MAERSSPNHALTYNENNGNIGIKTKNLKKVDKSIINNNSTSSDSQNNIDQANDISELFLKNQNNLQFQPSKDHTFLSNESKKAKDDFEINNLETEEEQSNSLKFASTQINEVNQFLICDKQGSADTFRKFNLNKSKLSQASTACKTDEKSTKEDIAVDTKVKPKSKNLLKNINILQENIFKDEKATSQEKLPLNSMDVKITNEVVDLIDEYSNSPTETEKVIEDIIINNNNLLSLISDNKATTSMSSVNHNESLVNSGTMSSESTLSYYDNDVQSMDAIERRDFEHEQRSGGEILFKPTSTTSENNFNLGIIKSYQIKHNFKTSKEETHSSNSDINIKQNELFKTQLVPKCNIDKSLINNDIPNQINEQKFKTCSSNVTCEKSKSPCKTFVSDSNLKFNIKTTIIQNFTVCSEKYCGEAEKSHNSSIEPIPGTSSSFSKFVNINEKENNNETNKILMKRNTEFGKLFDNEKIDSKVNFLSEDIISLNKTCNASDFETLADSFENLNTFKSKFNERTTNQVLFEEARNDIELNPIHLPINLLENVDSHLVSEHDNSKEEKLENKINEKVTENDDILVRSHQNDNFIDDETWADCEEASDDEVCTCQNSFSTDRTYLSPEEDDLPSKDVDLSSYIQTTSLSEDILLRDNSNIQEDFSNCSQFQGKRKYSDNFANSSCKSNSQINDKLSNDIWKNNRKRIALDNYSTPQRSCTYHKSSNTSPALIIGRNTDVRKTPRSIIPTKDNPPPELHDWISQFSKWSHVERLVALDRLIEKCEAQQVRHMMKVIEPQFQRDFISLLPKELALQVLSYLEPKDLLRAAQTCRSWQYLCDDNLLWKEKCKSSHISAGLKNGISNIENIPKRGRAGNMPYVSSPWKAAYMRQYIIETNWRSRPIRNPKILKGHDDHVITCLQFSGNRIVSGSDDNTLKVWSAVTGKCLRTLVGHTGGVWSSQLSENIIISGSTDRTLKVWNMETGQCIHTLLGHTSTVRCMHLHGNKVVSGSRDATLRVWDIEKGICLHVLVGHLAAVRCVQYDGKLVVSGAYDYMVKIWHPERQECLHTLQGHTNRVYSLQFDGIHVVSGSLDTSIRVWDAETGNPKHTLMGHQSLTSGMELRQNILVSGNADSTVKVWDITTGQCLQTLSGPNKHQSAVTCLQFNSSFVITSSDDGTVKLWDVKTGEFIRNLVSLDSGGSGGVVWRIRASDTKLICAVGSRNGTEETKLMVLDFDVEGACAKCS